MFGLIDWMIQIWYPGLNFLLSKLTLFSPRHNNDNNNNDHNNLTKQEDLQATYETDIRYSASFKPN